MAFKYSCFISYRGGSSPLLRYFLTDLNTYLKSALEAEIPDLDIFIDSERLQSGDSYDVDSRRLARALCESVCMILVYTPTYFSPQYTLCAREFRAMRLLEERRSRVHGKQGRIILPIILRGSSDLFPKELMGYQAYDFAKFHTADLTVYRPVDYNHKLNDLAQHIYSIYRDSQSWEGDFTIDCQTFELPTESEIQGWLKRASAPPMIFPSRWTK